MSERRAVRERIPGQSAMQRVVDAQRDVPARGRVARLLGSSPLSAESRAAYRVAIAGMTAGDVLRGLGQRWDVLHDLALAGAVLDHLAIGPSGAYAIRAVDCGGGDAAATATSLTVAGEDRDDLRIVRTQAAEATAALGQAVEPLLVLVGARRASITSDAPVVDAGGLHRRLSRAPKLLDGDRVAALSDLADLPSTWAWGAGGRRDTARLHDGTAQVRDDTVQLHDDTVRLHDRFGSIRAEVRSAAGVRFAWIAGAAGIAVGVVWGVVAVLVGGAVGA